MNSVWTDFARLIFHVQVQAQPAPGAAPAPPPAPRLPARRQLDRRGDPRQLLLGRRSPGAGAIAAAAGPAAEEELALPAHVEQRQRLRRRAARPQRPVLVRLGQEVQALPRRMTSAPEEPTRLASRQFATS